MITRILDIVGDATEAFNAALPHETKPYRDETSTLVYSETEREEALRDFELLAVSDALQALADEIDAETARRHAAAYQKVLEAYYVMEEMAQDPQHAELLPWIDQLRSAHEASYGKPIPPRDPVIASRRS